MEVPVWNNVWELPGGGAEVKETLAEVAIRECYEETGYRVKIKKPQPIFTGEQFFKSEHLNKYFHSVFIVFEGELVSNKRDVHVINTLHEDAGELDEISKVDWIDPKSLNKKNCHPNFYQLIKDGGSRI